MPIDWSTGLNAEVPTSEELMACPIPRVALVSPVGASGEAKQIFEETVAMWGNVPRYIQLLAQSPPAARAWNLLDRELRLQHLGGESDFVQLEELAIVKTSLINRCNY